MLWQKANQGGPRDPIHFTHCILTRERRKGKESTSIFRISAASRQVAGMWLMRHFFVNLPKKTTKRKPIRSELSVCGWCDTTNSSSKLFLLESCAWGFVRPSTSDVVRNNTKILQSTTVHTMYHASSSLCLLLASRKWDRAAKGLHST